MIFNSKFKQSIGLIFVSIYILICLHPTFTLDESFTFGLIQHHISRLIYLDTMDVHPPLYYILLKIFLIITTFWTKSVFVKVIFARVFSFIMTIIFCFVIYRIFYLFQIHVHFMNWLLIFLLMPPTMMFDLKIRMYSLAALLVLMTFYNLIEFDNYNYNILNLVYATLFAILSSYTFYFAGLSAGLFIVAFIIKYLWNKDLKHLLQLSVSSFILILSFIPWLPIALKQMIYHSHNDNNNIIIDQVLGALSQSTTGGIKTLICIVIIILLFLFIMYSYKNLSNTFNNLLNMSLINFICTLLISLALCGRKFQSGALYPSFMIIASLLSFTVLYGLAKNKKFYRIACYIFISLLVVLSFSHIYRNIKTYDMPSIMLVRNYNNWKRSTYKNIILKSKTFPLNKQMTASEDSVYLYPLHKNIVLIRSTYSKFSTILLNDNNNNKLVKDTFPNIRIKNK